MKLRYTAYARDNLVKIRSYIAQHNPQAASRVINHIRQQAQLLSDYPHLGKEGRCEGTRELVISLYPYIVAYRVYFRRSTNFSHHTYFNFLARDGLGGWPVSQTR